MRAVKRGDEGLPLKKGGPGTGDEGLPLRRGGPGKGDEGMPINTHPQELRPVKPGSNANAGAPMGSGKTFTQLSEHLAKHPHVTPGPRGSKP